MCLLLCWEIVFNSSRGAQILGGRSPGGLNLVQQCLDIVRSSVWSFLHVIKLASEILRCLLDFWKLCASLNGIIESLLFAMSPVFSKFIFNILTLKWFKILVVTYIYIWKFNLFTICFI